MCCNRDNAVMSSLLRLKKVNGKILCWKVLRIKEQKRYSPFMCCEPAWKFNRYYRSNHVHADNRNDTISYGIHVFLYKKDALKCSRFRYNRKIFQVYCDLKDLIGVGVWSDNHNIKQAVFKKVFLPIQKRV